MNDGQHGGAKAEPAWPSSKGSVYFRLPSPALWYVESVTFTSVNRFNSLKAPVYEPNPFY